MAEAPVLGAARASKVALDDDAFGARFNGPLAARVGARRAGRAPARHRLDARPAAWSPAATPSPGARRAPAARAPARRARRSSPAAASSSGPIRAPTPSRSIARSAAPRCAARSRCTRSAARSRSSTPPRSMCPRPSRRPTLLADWGRAAPDAGRRRPPRSGAPGCHSATSSASRCSCPRTSASPTSSAPPRCCARAAALDAADRPRRRAAHARTEEVTRLMEHSQVIIRPVVSEKSYVARRRRPLHVPRPPRRAQDADPPGRRGALRRPGRRGPHDAVKSKPKRRGQQPGAAAWKKAMVQVRAGRDRSRSSPGLEGLDV